MLFVLLSLVAIGYSDLVLQGRVVALDKSANKRDKMLSNVKLWAADCVDVYICDSSKCISSDAGRSHDHRGVGIVFFLLFPFYIG